MAKVEHRMYCGKSGTACLVYHPDGVCDDVRDCEACILERSTTTPNDDELKHLINELANELANYWYQEQKYTANSRWQESKDEASLQLKALVSQLQLSLLQRLMEHKYTISEAGYQSPQGQTMMSKKEAVPVSVIQQEISKLQGGK